MRLSQLAVLVVLSVAVSLSYADDNRKNVDAPKEVERRDAPSNPSTRQQQDEASDTGKGFVEGV